MSTICCMRLFISQITGNYTWMYSALEALKESCVQELSRNSSIPSDITSGILANTCPNECSNSNGLCMNGEETVCNSICVKPFQDTVKLFPKLSRRDELMLLTMSHKTIRFIAKTCFFPIVLVFWFIIFN